MKTTIFILFLLLFTLSCKRNTVARSEEEETTSSPSSEETVASGEELPAGISEAELVAADAEAPDDPGVLRMVRVEGGTFLMQDWRNQKYHNVTVSDFEICSVEKEMRCNWWEAVVECNRMSREDGYTPCYNLNGVVDEREWGNPPDGSEFDKLKIWSEMKCDFNADGYRLPTSAEWEWAARGGNKSHGYLYSGSDKLDEVGWYKGNTEIAKTSGDMGGVTRLANGRYWQEPARKKPNELGLYDMSGNLWEWVWDWRWSYSELPQVNPTGYSDSGEDGMRRKTIRGGCWQNKSESCEVASYEGAESMMEFTGLLSFRPCRSLAKEFTDVITLEMNETNVNALKPVMIKVPCVSANPSLAIKPYEIGETELNRELYALMTGMELCQSEGNLPVEGLSWYEAVELCNMLSTMYGYEPCYTIDGEADPAKWPVSLSDFTAIVCDFNADGYRLPTEAEWEWAAMSGDMQKTEPYNGHKVNDVRSNCWYEKDSSGRCHSVLSKDTNWIKVYGMCGNVQEWCWDSYEEDDSRKSLRGGSYKSRAEDCTIYSRDGAEPDATDGPTGLRLCRSIGER